MISQRTRIGLPRRSVLGTSDELVGKGVGSADVADGSDCPSDEEVYGTRGGVETEMVSRAIASQCKKLGLPDLKKKAETPKARASKSKKAARSPGTASGVSPAEAPSEAPSPCGKGGKGTGVSGVDGKADKRENFKGECLSMLNFLRSCGSKGDPTRWLQTYQKSCG